MNRLTNPQVAYYMKRAAETIYLARGSHGVALQRDAFRIAIQECCPTSTYEQRRSKLFMLDGHFADLFGREPSVHEETNRDTLSYLFLFVAEFYRTGGFGE